MGRCEFSGGGQTVGGLPALPDSFCGRKAGTLCKAWLHPQPQVTPQGGLAFMHSPVPTNITHIHPCVWEMEDHLLSWQMRQLRH